MRMTNYPIVTGRKHTNSTPPVWKQIKLCPIRFIALFRELEITELAVRLHHIDNSGLPRTYFTDCFFIHAGTYYYIGTYNATFVDVNIELWELVKECYELS